MNSIDVTTIHYLGGVIDSISGMCVFFLMFMIFLSIAIFAKFEDLKEDSKSLLVRFAFPLLAFFAALSVALLIFLPSGKTIDSLIESRQTGEICERYLK